MPPFCVLGTSVARQGMSLVPSIPGLGSYCRKLWKMQCSTLQSITFQAIAGSRLDGSE